VDGSSIDRPGAQKRVVTSPKNAVIHKVMHANILTIAGALSDQDLLARLELLSGREREASVELVAHLAVLDTRPILYAANGYGSLFSYCTQALRLSEDAACNRIEAARACRRFPQILDLLSAGELSLTEPHDRATPGQASDRRQPRMGPGPSGAPEPARGRSTGGGVGSAAGCA
jgi:hypothetical protein